MSRIGKGIKFPVELSSTGKPITTTGSELIESSLRIILGWPYRDRFFLARFGAKLEELLEEPNGEVLESLVEFFIFESIRAWEPRVKFENTLILSRSPDKLEVVIQYYIVESSTRESFVYPFYKYRLT